MGDKVLKGDLLPGQDYDIQGYSATITVSTGGTTGNTSITFDREFADTPKIAHSFRVTSTYADASYVVEVTSTPVSTTSVQMNATLDADPNTDDVTVEVDVLACGVPAVSEVK